LEGPRQRPFSFVQLLGKVRTLGIGGPRMVRLWAANTDLDWFDYLTTQPDIDEVNFWQPSGHANFGAISEGELFLFKLKSPRNAIGGFGVLSQSTNMPLSLAWEAFGIKNGARSLPEMQQRIFHYRGDARHEPDPMIGCRVVLQPVFLPEEHWIPQPESWARSIVVGKTYETSTAEGLRLWEQVMAAAELATVDRSGVAEQQSIYLAPGPRYGEPHLIRPRLGQGAFRLAVTEAYNRECAITGGRVLPALDAAHIQAFGSGGEHEVSNGLLLRRDIHSVFDAGYLTFDEELRVVVSDRVRTEFNNGNEYRRLQGERLRVPPNPMFQPDPARLEWHRENRFAA
jgi:putative restriction endonuclease